jgi:phenylacetic acid degradation operon negative regulatory protein
MPGLWVSPHTDRADEAAAVIAELGLSDSTIAFIGTTAQIGLTDHEIVARAWDLDDIAAHYEQLMATYACLEPESGDEVLYTYLRLIHEWQRMPYVDPQLPDRLLPSWIGGRAITLFVELRDKWAAAAYDRWRELANLNVTLSLPPARIHPGRVSDE